MFQKMVLKLKEKYKERQIVVWGYGQDAIELSKVIQSEKLNIAFYVDESVSKIDGKNIRSISTLEGGKDNYFIIVSVAIEHDEINKKLMSMGYISNVDYLYISRSHKAIHVKNHIKNYEDQYGNRINCESDCVVEIIFTGCFSQINIGSEFSGKSLTLILHNNCEVTLGYEIQVNGKNSWEFFDNAKCIVGNGVHFGGSKAGGTNTISVRTRGNLRIGSGTSIGPYYGIMLGMDTFIFIGEDCLLSNNIVLRSCDGHMIFDVMTGEKINDTSSEPMQHGIIIANHCWLGYHTTIMYDTKIGEGSIVGAMTFVKGNHPNNCIIAGIPGRVIRKDVAWAVNEIAEDISSCGEYVRFTEDDLGALNNTFQGKDRI